VQARVARQVVFDGESGQGVVLRGERVGVRDAIKHRITRGRIWGVSGICDAGSAC
jgi:hypothetical protein